LGPSVCGWDGPRVSGAAGSPWGCPPARRRRRRGRSLASEMCRWFPAPAG